MTDQANTPPSFKVKPLSQYPSVWLCEGFLSDAECAHLISAVKNELTPSLVVEKDSGQSVKHPHRTSSQTFINRGLDPITTEIELRLSRLANIPVSHGEKIQVLLYNVGEEYRPHHDYFNPAEGGFEKVLENGGQRFATILMYLNDVEEGGETIFPTIDLKISPIKGNALLFYSVYSDGQLDKDSLHGSVPVLQGEKWVATQWFREREYNNYQ